MVMAAVYGAALMIAADLLARTARSPAELPLGVPFFLVRLRKLAQ